MLKDQGAGAELVSGLRCYLYSMDKGEGQATLTIELGTMPVTVRDDSQDTETNPDGRVEDVRQ